MERKKINQTGLIIGISLMLLLCLMTLLPIKAKAVETDPNQAPSNASNFELYFYSFGEEVEGELPADSTYVYSWDERSADKYHYSVTVQIFGKDLDELMLTTPAEDYYITKKYFNRTYNSKTKTYTYTSNIDFPSIAGLMLFNYSNSSVKYKIIINYEPVINLSKTSITEITNTKHLTMTVKYLPVRNRLGYQIEYSTNSKFNTKTRVNTGATTKDVGKLTKGNIYYVRVRSYARYSDGSLVYSKWSPTQRIKIKQ